MTPNWMKGTPSKPLTGSRRLKLDCPLCGTFMTKLKLSRNVTLKIYGCKHCKGWLCLPAFKETQTMVHHKLIL